LWAAQSPQPWFIVLVVRAKGNRPVKVYAVHVWDKLMRRTLKAARRAENEKRSLNRVWFAISFSAADERNEKLVLWMQHTIEALGAEELYRQLARDFLFMARSLPSGENRSA